MSYLQPIFLFGIVGIAIPIIIHLWSRKSRKTIPFGSIQFLQATATQSMRSVLPSDWLLLLLRIIVITILSFLLAKPLIDLGKQSKTSAVFVAPEYVGNPGLSEILDTSTHIFFFSTGFPDFDPNEIPIKSKNYWPLLHQIESTEFDKLTIVAPRSMNYFGEKRALPKVAYEWISLPANSSFDKSDDRTIRYYLFADDPEIKTLMDNCLQTLKSERRVYTASDSLQAEWVLWLSEKRAQPRRKMIKGSTTGNLLQKQGPDIWQINLRKFQYRNVLKGNFLYELEMAFGMNNPNLNRLEIPNDQLLSSAIPSKNSRATGEKALSSYLWIILLTVLLIERFLALKPGKS
jgi:hypothetical protein